MPSLRGMKLETLRKGFNVGHCVYSREAALIICKRVYHYYHYYDYGYDYDCDHYCYH